MNFTAHLYFKYFLEVYFYFSYQLLKIKLTEYFELQLIRTKNSCAFIRYNGKSSCLMHQKIRRRHQDRGE